MKNEIKCPKCGFVNKFDSQKDLEKAIVEHDIYFYKHEEVSGYMAEEILRRLKYPNNMIKQIVMAIKNHMRTKSYGKESELVSDKAIRKLKADLGDHLQTTLNLIHADNISHADDYNMPMQVPKLKDRLKSLENEPVKPKLPIDGNDIMKHLGIKPGPMIKHLLDAVKDVYFENPALTKKQAFSIVDKRYKEVVK